MKVGYSIFLAIGLSSCATNPRTTQGQYEPTFDVRISVVDVGGFRLQMTPRAALAVIKAKGYRESSGNRVTLEDLISNSQTQDAFIEVFEFSHGESLDDRVMRETGIFGVDFRKGRVQGITYRLSNLTKDKLKGILKGNEAPFHFVTERETSLLPPPRNGTVISWKYKPIKFAHLIINYIEREPLLANPERGEPGIGQCEYFITVFDANPYLTR